VYFGKHSGNSLKSTHRYNATNENIYPHKNLCYKCPWQHYSQKQKGWNNSTDNIKYGTSLE
jgi:hypothetical protein